MQTEPTQEKEALERQLERMLAHFEHLSARIAFLAQALDVSLDTPAQAQAVLECDSACSASQGASARETRLREELRGLLVMRYSIVTRMAKSDWVGAQAARDILLCANDRLLAKGFDAQAPGMNLRPLFDGLDD